MAVAVLTSLLSGVLLVQLPRFMHLIEVVQFVQEKEQQKGEVQGNPRLTVSDDGHRANRGPAPVCFKQVARLRWIALRDYSSLVPL